MTCARIWAGLYREAITLVDRRERTLGVVMMISHAMRKIVNDLAHHLGQAEGITLPAHVNTSTPVWCARPTVGRADAGARGPAVGYYGLGGGRAC